jgi:hypothetical protein
MRRRRLLGSFAGLCTALTAGCLEETGPDSAETAPSETATTTGPTTTKSATDATSTRGAPDTDALTAAATVLQSSAADSPPRVAVEVTNTPEVEVRLSGGATLPFSSYRAEDGPLVALPDDREYVRGPSVPNEKTDGCWRADSNVLREDIGLMEAVPAGGSTSTRFTLLTAADAEECAVGDEYAFEHSLGVDSDHWSTGYGVDVELTVARNEAGDVSSASATLRTTE